jgi:predicted secreted protein
MNFMKTHLTIALLSLLAAACAAPTGEANDNQLVVTEAQNGHALKAAAGQDVIVSLTDHGDGGYQWVLVSAGGLGDGTQSHVTGSNQAGDFGTDEFTFTTAGLPEGSYTIKLVDERSWDHSTDVPFSVTVNVAQ